MLETIHFPENKTKYIKYKQVYEKLKQIELSQKNHKTFSFTGKPLIEKKRFSHGLVKNS